MMQWVQSQVTLRKGYEKGMRARGLGRLVFNSVITGKLRPLNLDNNITYT